MKKLFKIFSYVYAALIGFYLFRQETLVRIQCRLHSFQQKNIREMSDYKRNPISDFNKGLIMGIGVTAICYSVLMFILISLFK